MSDCIFCKIISGEIPSYKLCENDHAIAFLDVNPAAEGHTLVIPKKHCLDLSICDQESLQGVIMLVQHVSRVLQRSKKLDVWGINYLSNQGKIAGQVVNHFHMHVIPKYSVNEGLKITTENVVNLIPLKKVQENFVKTQKKMLKGRFSKF